MSNGLVHIGVSVYLDIFRKPVVSKKLHSLVGMYENDLQEKYIQINEYLESKYPEIDIPYEDIRRSFIEHLCIDILKKAIVETTNPSGTYNIVKNILDVLTEDEIKEAIAGDIMIDSFSCHLLSVNKGRDLRAVFLSN